MNEPIISPWLIYAIEVTSNLNAFFTIAAIALGLGAGFLFVGCACCEEDYDGQTKKILSVATKLAIGFTVLLFFSLIIPTRETLVAMIVADNVTPANLESGKREAMELIDYVFEKIDRKEEER